MSILFTPVVRLGFPALFTPKAAPGSATLKYSAVLCFLPDDKGMLQVIDEATKKVVLKPMAEALKPLTDACKEAAIKKFGEKYLECYKQDELFKMDHKGFPKGSICLSVGAYATNKAGEKLPPPGIVDRYRDPKTGKARVITDPLEMYPGCQVIASVNPYAYDNVRKGVSVGLNNMQRWGDGTRFDGRQAAADEFDGQEPEAADGVDDLL
jgi:hypothetical protein